MNAHEIFEIIKEETSYIQYFGLRALTQNIETGEFEAVEVGGVVKNSYSWDNGKNTGKELDGVSAVKINEADMDEIEQAIYEMEPYLQNAEQVVLLGSNEATPGEDNHERIMRDAQVLAVWSISCLT